MDSQAIVCIVLTHLIFLPFPSFRSSPCPAPSGCDQYLTGVKGEVKSFNYDTKPSSKTHENGNPGEYTASLSPLCCHNLRNIKPLHWKFFSLKRNIEIVFFSEYKNFSSYCSRVA